MEEFRDGIQGMNLGWAGIEQGDELESSDVHEMLQGRLRRIVTPNEEVQDLLVKRGLLSNRVEDFAVLRRSLRNRIERYIKNKLRLPVRQIITIANACGHNWIWKTWVKPSQTGKLLPGYTYHEGHPFENLEFIPQSTRMSWKRLRKTSPRKYNRYVMNSHEDYDIEGAYYAALMSDALKEGRSEIDTLYDRTRPVCTFWDLGVDDETAIWFLQIVNGEPHLVDYYSNNGQGMEFYSEIMDEKKFHYTDHFLPHDAKQRLQGVEITTRLNILRRLRKGENVHVVEKTSIADRIQAVRLTIPKCKFSAKCEDGVEHLNRYHRDVNKAKSSEDRTVFVDHPAHDEHSHAADAFGCMAIVLEYTPSMVSDEFSVDNYDDSYDDTYDDIGSGDMLEVSNA